MGEELYDFQHEAIYHIDGSGSLQDLKHIQSTVYLIFDPKHVSDPFYNKSNDNNIDKTNNVLSFQGKLITKQLITLESIKRNLIMG